MKKYFLIILFFILPFIFSHAEDLTIEDLTIHDNPLNKPTPIVDIAICCVFKNEASWLKEWIEFHRLIGVEHFYLYDNLSTDDYMDVLGPYIAEGVVELYHFPVFPFKNTYQPILYTHALDIAKRKNKWLAIIDTDEFICPVITTNLKDYLEDHQSYGAVAAHWQMYGTSNVKTLKPGELLIEKLIMRAPFDDPKHIHPKSIVQPGLVKECGIHECELYPDILTYYPSVEEIRINHYFVRTEDFLYNVKLERIKQWNENMFHFEDILNYVPIANSVLDISMLRFIRPLKKRMFQQTKASK